jgi:GAF domain-containing protein
MPTDPCEIQSRADNRLRQKAAAATWKFDEATTALHRSHFQAFILASPLIDLVNYTNTTAAHLTASGRSLNKFPILANFLRSSFEASFSPDTE